MLAMHTFFQFFKGMSEFYETFFFYASFIMQSLSLQKPHYIWSSYGKLEIQF